MRVGLRQHDPHVVASERSPTPIVVLFAARESENVRIERDRSIQILGPHQRPQKSEFHETSSYFAFSTSQVAALPAFELMANSIEGYFSAFTLAGAFTKNRLLVSPVVPLRDGHVGAFLEPSLA